MYITFYGKNEQDGDFCLIGLMKVRKTLINAVKEITG